MKNIFLTLLFVSIVGLTFATQSKKTVKIRLASPGGSYAETTIYFDLGVVPAFISSQDAPEVYNTFPGGASVYSLSSDNVLCSTNGYSTLTSAVTIALGVKADSAGDYAFTASLLSNFDSTSVIQLEDIQTHTFVDLRNNFYAFHIADSGSVNNRFLLHVSTPVHTSTVTAGCANNNGAINVIQDASVVWSSVNLFDASGTFISGYNMASGNFVFGNLPEGSYKMILSLNGVYVSTLPLQVKGNHIVASINPMALTASVNQDITFHTTELNGTNCFWNFGDSSEINGIDNPTFEYKFAGVFKAVLICSNDSGCQSRDSVTITVTEATAIQNVSDNSRNIRAYAKTVTLSLNETITTGAEVKIYSLLGQPVYTASIDQLTTEVTLNNQTDGYYIVSLTNNNVTTTQRVVLVK